MPQTGKSTLVIYISRNLGIFLVNVEKSKILFLAIGEIIEQFILKRSHL